MVQPGKDKDRKLECKFSFEHKYPPTKIMWAPDWENCYEDLMVTSGEVLRVWRIEDNNRAELKCALSAVVVNKDRQRKNSMLHKPLSIGVIII